MIDRVLRIDGWSNGCSGEDLRPNAEGQCPFCKTEVAITDNGLIAPHEYENTLITYQVLEPDHDKQTMVSVHVGTVEVKTTATAKQVRDTCQRAVSAKFGKLGFHPSTEFKD